MSLAITFYNLFASSLVIDLIGPPNKEVRMKSFTPLGVEIFGTKVIKELLMLCKSVWPCRNHQSEHKIHFDNGPTHLDEEVIEAIWTR
jgi:hypothetical protein